MFKNHTTPLLDRITPNALAVRLSDPRYSAEAKRAAFMHALRAARADGDVVAEREIVTLMRSDAPALFPNTYSTN